MKDAENLNFTNQKGLWSNFCFRVHHMKEVTQWSLMIWHFKSANDAGQEKAEPQYSRMILNQQDVEVCECAGCWCWRDSALHCRTGCDFQGTVHGAGRFVTSNLVLETPLKSKKAALSFMSYSVLWHYTAFKLTCSQVTACALMD